MSPAHDRTERAMTGARRGKAGTEIDMKYDMTPIQRQAESAQKRLKAIMQPNPKGAPQTLEEAALDWLCKAVEDLEAGMLEQALLNADEGRFYIDRAISLQQKARVKAAGEIA